jgi:hypothetical protein
MTTDFRPNRQPQDRQLTFAVSSPDARQPQSVSKSAIVAMVIIVVVLALVSLFANVQRLRRDKIERTIVTPANPSPAPTVR